MTFAGAYIGTAIVGNLALVAWTLSSDTLRRNDVWVSYAQLNELGIEDEISQNTFSDENVSHFRVFSPSARANIELLLKKSEYIELSLFDVTGKMVEEIVKGFFKCWNL